MEFLLGFSNHFCTSSVLQLNELRMPREKIQRHRFPFVDCIAAVYIQKEKQRGKNGKEKACARVLEKAGKL